ncbi:MAG TPA: choice-of-anchor tandem repeat GloVer-containing protein [Candidatus Acidoferrales bacterium]|nr:choice-of-anchor tandem repeat GloVer-containing protein [Candidatus Acidoferrales bacterium]
MNKSSIYRLSTLALLALLVLFAANSVYAQTYSVLYDFGTKSGDPLIPESGLTQGADGALYGTTGYGGANDTGTVFKSTTAGRVRALYSFCAESVCGSGTYTPSSLTLRPDAHFLGATAVGGASTYGTLFDVTPTGTLTTLYNFSGGTDGAYPYVPPILSPDGNFYGIVNEGGNEFSKFGCGTAYRLTGAGSSAVFTLLHEFTAATEGCNPTSLVLGADGNFYGTAAAGGEVGNGYGTVFKMTRNGKVTLLHSFDDVHDGAGPYSLILGNDGNFYGTAALGPSPQQGTIFKITPGGTLTVLHVMSGAEGADPAGLVQATDGNFYGVARNGGSSTNCGPGGCGTLFKMTPAGELTVLYDFDFTTGAYPLVPIQHTNGVLFGVTHGGGIDDNGNCASGYCGVLFSLNNHLPPFVALVPSQGRVGILVEILGQGFTPSTTVSFNGKPAAVKVTSGTQLFATVPFGATTGYVRVTTSTGTLTSNQRFVVAP